MPRLLFIRRWSVLVALAACVVVPSATPRRAQAQDESTTPVYLRDNPAVKQTQAEVLRQGMKERAFELKERAEAARKAAKQTKHHRGTGVQPYVPPPDETPAPASARTAEPAEVLHSLSIPTNVQANNPSETGDNTSTCHSEEHIAMSGNYGIADWNDGNANDGLGVAYTTNGGATWTDAGHPPIPAGWSYAYPWFCDPSVGVNEKTGDFYYCAIVLPTSSTNGIATIRASFPGGVFTWDTAHLVRSGSNSTMSFDKPWMYADSATGNIYCTYTLFSATDDTVLFQRSTDKGVTWGNRVVMNDVADNGYASGSRPISGPSGEVYVAWATIGLYEADYMKIRKSTDGGLTFGAVAVIDSEYSNWDSGAPGFNRQRGITFPSLGVDRSCGAHRGRIYCTWNEAVNYYEDPLGYAGNKNEVEANNSPATATPFTIGQVLRGTVSSSDLNDYYSWSATQGTTYIFFLDSLNSATRYNLWVYCSDQTTQLGLSGQNSSSYAADIGIIVWTAPTTATYYLRMNRTAGSSTRGYRIQTGVHVANIHDIARDHRDAMVAYSDNGSTWSVQNRMNDEPGWFDDWFPEVQVTSEGYVYGMWYDWRDATANCGGRSNIYTTRSEDGGVTWLANQRVSDATTAWTTVSTNLIPNEGDYLGLYANDSYVAYAWADGRNGRPDIYTAKLNQSFTAGCGSDATVASNTLFNFSDQVSNASVMFPYGLNYTLTADRNWPGMPQAGSLTVAASGVTTLPFSVQVPDTAANGIVHLCLTSALPSGCLNSSCCLNLTVFTPPVATLASLVSASAEAGQVQLQWELGVAGAVNLYRSDDGATWTRLGQLVPDGSSRVSYADANVTGGGRYGYRLGILSAGREVMAGETWVNVPRTAVLALQGAQPNPTAGVLSFSFSLANDRPATLELLDLAGRRVFERQVGGLGAGFHVVRYDGVKLPVGMYAIRLTQAGRTLTGKVAVVR